MLLSMMGAEDKNRSKIVTYVQDFEEALEQLETWVNESHNRSNDVLQKANASFEYCETTRENKKTTNADLHTKNTQKNKTHWECRLNESEAHTLYSKCFDKTSELNTTRDSLCKVYEDLANSSKECTDFGNSTTKYMEWVRSIEEWAKNESAVLNDTKKKCVQATHNANESRMKCNGTGSLA